MVDIKKHLEEWDQKYKDLTTELFRARDDDILLKTTSTSKSSTVPSSGTLTSPRFFKSAIKPRMAQILPKTYYNFHLDLERKRKSDLLPEIPVKLSKNSDLEQAVTIRQPIGDSKESKRKLDAKQTRRDLGILIGNLIKNPLTSIQSRKRKMAEDIDLK